MTTNNLNLDDVVRQVIRDFVKADRLFTGLDVSNEVKKTLPFARHSEVSDLVRQLFTTDVETEGYGRTPIDVTLSDGSTRTALLYHPLADSWDLDTKYDTQKRAQTSSRPVSMAQSVVAVTPTVSLPPSLPVPVTPPSTPKVNPVVPVVHDDARAQWDNLFKSQPSLFPRN